MAACKKGRSRIRLIAFSLPSLLCSLLFQASLDSVKSHHELRMAKLEQMIEERRRLKEDHDAGRRRLTSEEYDRANKQLNTFSRKLEQMKKRTDEVFFPTDCRFIGNRPEFAYTLCCYYNHRTTLSELRS